jgi:hypothetical protein
MLIEFDVIGQLYTAMIVFDPVSPESLTDFNPPPVVNDT